MALFNAWIKRHPHPRDWAAFTARTAPRWSGKARALSALAYGLSFGRARLFPHALRIAVGLLRPLETFATQWLTLRAGRALRRSGIAIVIGITGSYGKTTTKEILSSLLVPRFRVHATPENVNTLLGVAKWILALDLQREALLVVEMGAYRRGDIARLCRLLRPTIGILTGINAAHLERFGTIENTKAAKCELFDHLPPASGGIGFWNQDSALAREAVAERAWQWGQRGIALVPYTRTGTPQLRLDTSGVQETSFAVRVAKRSAPGETFEARVNLLGQHHGLALSAAVAVADAVGLSMEEIRRGCGSIRPIARRLSATLGPAGQLIVDDSYNITLEGAEAGIEAIQHIKRRKVGVFAGIPEAGVRSSALNRALGRLIAGVFDVLLLRDTPVRGAVEAGLYEAGWDKANLFRYTDRDELERLLGKVLTPGDCLYLSAYDWPAIYL